MYHGQLLIIAENTGVLTKQEYDEFINELVKEDKNGTYLYSKPYYIYKGIKKIVLKTGSTFIYVKVEPSIFNCSVMEFYDNINYQQTS